MNWPNVSGVIGSWPYLLAVPLVFLAGAMWDGDGREDRAQRKANQLTLANVLVCATDKASLYEEIRNARSVNAAISLRFERITGASDDERANFRRDMAASALREADLRDQAHQAMLRLDNARGDIERAWRDGRIPAGIMCGVLQSPGCPDLSGRPAGAAGAGGVALPRPAADAPAAGAGVPGAADRRPDDAGGEQ